MIRVPSVLQRLGWWAGATLAALFVLWAGFWAWAENGAEDLLVRLNDRLSTPHQAARWRVEWSALETAIKLNPASADYLQLQALAAQRIGASRLAEAGIATEPEAFISELYRGALRRRPHWGALWARSAVLRMRSGASLESAWSALERAKTFALYESEVLQTALRLGFSYWPRLNAEQRASVRESVAFVLQHSPRTVIDLAIAFDWVEQLRPMLQEPRDIQYLDGRLERAELFSTQP